MATVYLLHFDHPYKHVQHYIGVARDLDTRLATHRCGRGARLIEVIIDAGINFTLVRTWAGGRKLERQLKNRKNAPRLCPICNPDHWTHQAGLISSGPEQPEALTELNEILAGGVL